MKNRQISWQHLLIAIYGAVLLSLPLAIGYIPIYHWVGLHTPTNLGMRWVYGLLYCLIEAIAIFLILFVVAFFYQIKRLFDFIFPNVENQGDLTHKVNSTPHAYIGKREG